MKKTFTNKFAVREVVNFVGQISGEPLCPRIGCHANMERLTNQRAWKCHHCDQIWSDLELEYGPEAVYTAPPKRYLKDQTLDEIVRKIQAKKMSLEFYLPELNQSWKITFEREDYPGQLGE